jgi:uncharacterized protein YecE (DUF72 family)
MSPIRIGTSGWNYKDWRETLYPKDVPASGWLKWYSGRFSTVEINSSFYRTPSLEAVAAWRDQTPDDFVFAWKASKFITHWKRLTEKCRNSLELMETRLKVLGRKLGPVLFQLPPQFKADHARLAGFLKLLNKRRSYAFEFRDESWYDPKILKLLSQHDIALCFSDHHDAPAPWETTASHLYIRGHGPTGRYHGSYPKPSLERWADEIRRARKQGSAIYCYFDNDQKAAAPKDAQTLLAMVKDRS